MRTKTAQGWIQSVLKETERLLRLNPGNALPHIIELVKLLRECEKETFQKSKEAVPIKKSEEEREPRRIPSLSDFRSR